MLDLKNVKRCLSILSSITFMAFYIKITKIYDARLIAKEDLYYLTHLVPIFHFYNP